MFSRVSQRSMTLYELLDKMLAVKAEDRVPFGSLLDVMEKRGFGPMLAAPAFICSSPIGAIPGIPTVTGITIFLISVQVLLFRDHPWLPSPIRDISISKKSLSRGVNQAKPWMLHVDKFLVPRWFFMQQAAFRGLIALCCGLCGLMMIPLELIPFLGLVPAFAVLIMSIGMATDDGAVAMLGVSVAMVGFITGGQQVWLLTH